MKDYYSQPRRDKIEAERLRKKWFADKQYKKTSLKILKDRLFSAVSHYRWWKEVKDRRASLWSNWSDSGLKRHLKRIKAIVAEIKKARAC